MEPFSSKTVGGQACDIVLSFFVCLIMNHGIILEQNVGGSTRETATTIFVCDCLIMNHGTIFHKL